MTLTLTDRIQRFQALHHAPKGFLLPNAWDCASARIFEAAGYPAIGTTSAGIAYARGRQDGQTLSRDDMSREVAAIVNCVNVPVNADIEAGYGDTPQDVCRTVTAFLSAGAVGMNLEDATGRSDTPLYTLSEQERRLSAARHAADTAGVTAYINARTDTFISAFGDSEEERLDETIRRGRAYLAAGADSVFVPLVTAPDTIRLLAREIGGPITVMAFPGAPTVAEMLAAGATRVSLGQSVMLATLGLTARIAQEFQQTGQSQAMSASFYGFGEAEALFSPR